jgi:hypothetical protein
MAFIYGPADGLLDQVIGKMPIATPGVSHLEEPTSSFSNAMFECPCRAQPLDYRHGDFSSFSRKEMQQKPVYSQSQ